MFLPSVSGFRIVVPNMPSLCIARFTVFKPKANKSLLRIIRIASEFDERPFDEIMTKIRKGYLNPIFPAYFKWGSVPFQTSITGRPRIHHFR